MICGLILAGGASRRFGSDKAMALLRGRPLIAHAVAALAPLPCAISANGDPARFAGLGLPVLPDGDLAGLGPLAGLARGLEWAAGQGYEAVLSLPCDTLGLPEDLLPRLLPAPAYARAGGRDHYLAGLWPVAAGQALAAHLRAGGSGKVGDWCRAIGARGVAFAGAGLFANFNRPEDLAALEAQKKGPFPGS